MPKHTSKKNIKRPRILESLTYLGDNFLPTSINLIQYDKLNYTSKRINTYVDSIKEVINEEKINWFKIVGISNVDLTYNICKLFGVRGFDVKDLIANHEVTKIISYPSSTFILLSCPTITSENKLEINQIAFILTDHSIVSIQEKDTPVFDDAILAIESNKVQIRDKGCDFLLYILLNYVYALYNDCILKIANDITDLEDSLIAQDTNNINVMQFIQNKKKDYFRLKRMISPMREEYPNLYHNTNSLISTNNLIYFNDFDDRIRIAFEDIEALHEAIISLSDLYFNNNNLQMNSIIKRLTVVSSIFIPLTFMAGVWGMNFDIMPELNFKYGYLYAWATMIIVAIAIIVYLRKKKWF